MSYPDEYAKRLLALRKHGLVILDEKNEKTWDERFAWVGQGI